MAKVAVVDIDPQGSISKLKAILTEYGVDLIPPEKLHEESEKYDIIIIDSPPYQTNSLPEFFEYSDFVLVPTKAGILDIMAISATIALLKKAQQKKPNLKSAIVLNMVKGSTNLTDDIKEALSQYEFTTLKTMIYDRVSFTRSPISGGVFETEDEKAKEEIVQLTEEIINMLQ